MNVLGLQLLGEAAEGVYLSCSFLSQRLGGVFSRINLRPPRVASFQGSRLGAVGAPVGGIAPGAGHRSSERRQRGEFSTVVAACGGAVGYVKMRG